MKRVLVTAGALALLAAAPPAPAPNPAVATALCALGFSAVPMRRLAAGQHLIDVRINGRPAAFIVDTGASGTVIDDAAAAGFGLKPGANLKGATVIGATGSTGLRQLIADSFVIGDVRTALTRVYAVDLSPMVKAVRAMTGKPLEGVIGQDLMRAQHAVVDVAQSRLYLMPLPGEPSNCAGPR